MKIISGGQTGVDLIALQVAKGLGFETGGTAPRGYKTEDGPNLELRDIYGLDEHDSPAYPPRTKCNIVNSDCTWIFGSTNEPGTKLTIKLCKELRKPFLTNPSPAEMAIMRNELKVEIINVAGNRGSKLNDTQEWAVKVLLSAGLTHLAGQQQKLL